MKEVLEKFLKVVFFSLVSFIICFFYIITKAYAAEIELTKFTPNNINYTINNGKLELNCIINDEGNYEIHGDMNTLGLEEGYYTSYIYENKKSDWSGFDGASFIIENMGEGAIDFNFNIICGDGRSLKVLPKDIMLMKRENSSIIERIHLPYGAVNINSGFIGQIYIPFESLSIDGGDNKAVIKEIISKIDSWGISITCRENETRHFKISDLALINSGQGLESYLKNAIEIVGDDNVVIPTAGEYIYKLQE